MDFRTDVRRTATSTDKCAPHRAPDHHAAPAVLLDVGSDATNPDLVTTSECVSASDVNKDYE